MWFVVVAVVVLVLVAYAFWPRKRGVMDAEARRSQAVTQGRVQPYSNNPNLPGPGPGPM